MSCYAFEGLRPVVDPTSYVHPSAVLIGDVQIGPRCYIGPCASLRGDFGRILVEGDASVQDNCTLHTGAGSDVVVGRGSTIGHGVVLHGCTTGENVLVGMNSVILDGAVIGAESLIAAMSLVKNDAQIPARVLVAGNPARVIRPLTPEAILWRQDGEGEYQRLADRSLADLVECAPLSAPETGRKRNSGAAMAVRLSKKQE